MFTKIHTIVVAILLAFSCVSGANAGNFNTSATSARLLDQAKMQLEERDSDIEKAESLLQQAAKHGSEEAYLILGRIYTRHSEKKDYDTASFWLTKAAELGSTKAMDMLALIYLDGRVVEQDYSKAAYWLQRGSDAGDPSATYNLADFYMQGTGVAKDPAMATRLLKQAAMKGHPYSIDYFVEEARKDNSEAQQFLEQLHAEQGHDSDAFKKYRQETK
ncbi:MAG: sel1 repeat family protein [Proteobacteria bacterium]|nr:sel1 repeat family protein [Pseudomonadota bacterium]